MKTPNHDTLVELLLANELSPEQQRQLRELAAKDSSIADEVLDQMWLEPLLRDSFRSDADAFVGRVEAARDRAGGDTTRFTERLVDAWTARSAARSRRKLIGVVAGACLVLGLVLLILFYPGGTGPTARAAPRVQIQNALGDVKIVSSNGESRPVEPWTQIKPGDTITTAGKSSATVSWDNGSRVILTRDASLTWPADKPGSIFLNAGLALIALSTPGGSTPVVFATPHATVEVPDAEFLLATSDRQTDVTVKRGKARLTGSDGRSVEVSGGECGVAKPRSLEVRKGSATPDTWSEDFETGLPGDWKQGKFVNADLPEGSRGAVRTVLSRNADGDPCHQIWTYAQWEHGLAVVHEDTCLNFVYMFKKADSVQVLTLMRSPVPDSPVHDVQMLQPSDVPRREQWWKIPSKRWYTVSIPLSRLSNPVSRERPAESFIATAFNLRPQDHACGLVIDRMWLARGTSKKIQFKPLETQGAKP